MQMDLSSYPYVDFSATIPSHPDNVSTVYWKAVIYDTCGNSLVVDNNGQLYSYSRGIFEYIKQTGKLNPTLYDDWNWTYIFTSGADHLDEVWIHKSLEGNNGIEEEDILLNPIDTFNTTYSIEICHDLEHFSGTYKFMFCSDEGDNYTIEEIQLKKPSIRIEQEEKPLSLLDLSQSTSHNISFKIPEYNEYIDYVSIEYEYDNGEDKRMENMTKIGELYTFSFKNFPKNATQVNYTVIAVDIFGNNITWDQYQSIKLLPALPEWEMSAEVQAIVALSSLIIGIGCAVVYSSTMGSETQNSIEDKLGIKAEKDEKRLKTNERNEQDIGFIIGKLSSISKKGLMIGTLATLYAVATILAVVSIFGLKSSEIAMVLLTGAFLSMVTIWVLLFGHFTEKTFRSNQLKLPISYKIILLGISIIIYVVLFSIFLVGNTIAWWRVRVNELSYNIAGIRIPRALTTVTTAFFSSILLLTWSTLKELSKKTEEFFESMELNENPLKIAERKEKSINSIVNSIGKKGILFVTIIGVVIIFASDLSIYANQGMLIVIPFALGALLTLFIYSIRRKKEEPTIQKRLLDNTVICAQCGEKTALSGTYCEFCGNRLLSGERASNGILCENCKKINIRGGKFCRHCGTELKEQNFEEKQATKEPSKTKNEKSSKPKPKNKDKKKEGKP
ncbi:MAG: conserved membrane protein of unknown function [Promethearchaeota archaeon]|nr:MAG: conserved membrane protein of unknown function [Candidatus Lokiarchaeota archaeon]